MAEEVFRILLPDALGGWSVWEGALCSAHYRSCKPNSYTHIPPRGMDHAESLHKVDSAYAMLRGLAMREYEMHSSDSRNSDLKRIRVKCEFPECERGSDDQGEGVPTLQAGRPPGLIPF